MLILGLNNYECYNGEIISLVSLPDFNPNHPEDIKV